MAIIKKESESKRTSALRDEFIVNDIGKDANNTKSHFLNGTILIAL